MPKIFITAAATLFATPAFAVQQVIVVPEPSTLGLLAAGVAGVVVASRLRKRK